MSSEKLISVVIPTKNGADTIERCLQSLADQTHKNIEVLVLDSGSKDATRDICATYSFVKVIPIPPHKFNHGLTRNKGVEEAQGDYILFTVQDAYACTQNFLEMMLSNFLTDDELVGVCGQQIVPHDSDKNPHEWFRSKSKPEPWVVQVKDKEELKALSPSALRNLCGWDNVVAMYRKSILQMHPFQEVTFGEDMLWAKEALSAGYKIVYDFRCRVYHYHHGTYDYTYKRMLTVLYYTYKHFGYLRIIKHSPSDYLKIIYRNAKYKANLYWIFFTWRKMKAAKKAYTDVKYYLSLGEEALDRFHQEQCGLPPQGRQNIKTN